MKSIKTFNPSILFSPVLLSDGGNNQYPINQGSKETGHGTGEQSEFFDEDGED